VAETLAEPATGPPAGPGRVRLLAALIGAVLALAALLIGGRELIAARVPQHRAALEELIRHETGLEVTFSRLSVRWGWYGPEAVFHAVTLGEREAPAFLRATELVVGLDAWRSVRSGQLEAGRITLIDPDIDLGARAGARLGTERAGPGAPAEILADARRVLGRWRGGRIDIQSGTLRWPVPAGAAPLLVTLRRADLRRLGADWSADADLLLPDTLGGGAHLGLRVSGELARPQDLTGTLTFSAAHLAFAGWRELKIAALPAHYLPHAGSGDLELRASFGRADPLKIAGTVRAESVEWQAQGGAALVLPRLRADWQLSRAGQEWRLGVGALDLGAGAHGSATLVLAGDAARGNLHQIPLTSLAALAHWYLPQLPLAELTLAGEARAINFDWNAQRPVGTRFRAGADIQGLTLANAAQDVLLSGLGARLDVTDTGLTAQLAATAARLNVVRAEPVTLEGLELHATVVAQLENTHWRVGSDDLQIRRGETHLTVSAVLAADTAPAQPRLDAHVQLKEADALLVANLLGPAAETAFGPGAARLTAGRIASTEFELHGPLATGGAAAAARGSLELRDAALAPLEAWPEVQELSAHIEWQDARVRASVTGARSGALQLSGAHVEWDARGEQPVRVRARLSGSARAALEWLRARPELAAAAPGAAYLDVEGETLLDVDLLVPGSGAHQPPARTRIVALLDGVRVHALAGLPPLEALRGTLAFSAGHLQHSTLTGQWLGGPVSLAIGERRDSGATPVAISARGFLDVHQALVAASAEGADANLTGNTEWSALLTVLPQTDAQPLQWRVRADSNLLGVASDLPEPLAKAANTPLPLRVEVQGQDADAQLHISLGERLQGLAALERSGDSWRIGRGALRLAANTPTLPATAVLALEGRVSRLDLPAYLALWQQAGRSPMLPALEAHLSAAELSAGTHVFHEVALVARTAGGDGQLDLQSPDITATLRWPAQVDGAHPVLVHLVSFDAARAGDLALPAGLTELLGPVVQLAVDDFSWQGRSLGRLSAGLSRRSEALVLSDLRLSAPHQELHAAGQCAAEARCSAQFSLNSTDLAHTLAAYGFRPDVAAQRAHLQGELEWLQGAPAALATVSGHLHMQLEEGTTRAQGLPGEGVPFALLVVPALISGLEPEPAAAAAPDLRFAQLTADFELRDGWASTANLHLDGDAEILVRGRVGLLGQDYDAEAFILRGEERLPSAVRRLGPTPKVAALWLSLREWFAGTGAENARAGLRLRGTWNDPIVMAAE
jgi:uncharacterized protein YhdP